MTELTPTLSFETHVSVQATTDDVEVDAPGIDEILELSGFSDLAEEVSDHELEKALRCLADVVSELRPDAGRFALIRNATIRALKTIGVPATARVVDGFLRVPAPEDAVTLSPVEDVVPWDEPVDGAVLADEVRDLVTRYVAMPRHHATAVAVWILYTHCIEAFIVAPILAITSPEKRCGKTRLLTVLSLLCPRALPSANTTVAAVFRVVHACAPTLLIDEADTFLHENSELVGILNSGHYRPMAKVMRVSGDDHDVVTFSTWAPKAIALIGKMKDTLRDRSIEIRMRRRTDSEPVSTLRVDRTDAFAITRRKLARWARDNVAILQESDPSVPTELNDRAADNWRPMLAIAALIGSGWEGDTRTAALALSADEESDSSAGVMLLHDLRPLMAESSRWHTRALLGQLTAMEDRPWPEWRRGVPLTARQLARLLGPFRVKPRKVRIGTSTLQGYWAEDFDDAFARYAPDPELPEPTPQPAPSNVPDVPSDEPGSRVGS
jgi:putative DNA primase/helicase